jgi:hypothetical protein
MKLKSDNIRFDVHATLCGCARHKAMFVIGHFKDDTKPTTTVDNGETKN